MAKDLDTLKWIEDLLPTSTTRKHMFGGFAYYRDHVMILALFEGQGEQELWNGCLFPTTHENQAQIREKFPELCSHPVLAKWLYLPTETEGFESIVENVIKEIRRASPLFGIVPKVKGRKAKRAGKPEKISFSTKPQMFRDESIETKLAKAKKISDLKNLGPATEKSMSQAGIKTVSQFVKLGWQKTMKKLVLADPKNRHSIFAYALIGALNNTDWNRISEADKKAARELCASLKPAKKLPKKIKKRA